MPTILELFENKDFQSKGLTTTKSTNVEVSSPDTFTLKELYENKDSYKFGTNYSTVKKDRETIVEQELSGIRIKSAAEINNPLIYGNEAGRIAIRSTPDVEKMKSSKGEQSGDGGLIGKGLDKLTGGAVKSLGDVRDKVNTVLGIPQNLIPTRLIGKIDTKEFTSIEPVTTALMGNNGTELGKLLKQSGGGTPKTILKNVAGAGIKKVKKNLRKSLFENSTNSLNPFKKKNPSPLGNIKDVTGEKEEKFGYSNIETYSKQLK